MNSCKIETIMALKRSPVRNKQYNYLRDLSQESRLAKNKRTKIKARVVFFRSNWVPSINVTFLLLSFSWIQQQEDQYYLLCVFHGRPFLSFFLTGFGSDLPELLRLQIYYYVFGARNLSSSFFLVFFFVFFLIIIIGPRRETGLLVSKNPDL